MRDYLREYMRRGINHSIKRLSLVRSDLPKIFEVGKYGDAPDERELRELMLERGWLSGLAAPCYGYGGAVGLTVLVSREKMPPEARIKDSLSFLIPRQTQLNAWAREALERQYRTESLSRREVECLMFVGEGKTSKDIADMLSISKRTVDFHIENAMNKMGVISRSQAVSRLSRMSIPHFPNQSDRTEVDGGAALTTIRPF
ncbi:hypothetical protein A0J57_04155 [Sphingobium sp. 22B]|uniref:helix-turn-helix transcriptional regulator n=1 Tax=unclassified Sphingobium TaxID=2611147 RepID=UPI000784E19C|nr:MULTISPECIES: helix-turn-helix transcriptional regulator [unclassified Sphingobium]KXU33839.1 hypothetical protein AXW74_00705 [Sphingobium sp. AM]KYC33783.1 hypothetical protein A0J57_04155 [Sphingobium sp. 22B]OAP33519.1 hypothetical protein A8O16_03375 [Sphingobium sp. 20006FA]